MKTHEMTVRIAILYCCAAAGDFGYAACLVYSGLSLARDGAWWWPMLGAAASMVIFVVCRAMAGVLEAARREAWRAR